MTRILVVLLALLTAACADMPRRSVEIERDDFAKVFVVHGIDGRFRGVFADEDRYALRSFVPFGAGAALHQLAVRFSYEPPYRHWQAAIDEHGRELPFKTLYKAYECRGCGTVLEIFAAELTDADLRRAAPYGLRVRFYAKSGDSQVVTLHPRQIAEQLAAIDRLR